MKALKPYKMLAQKILLPPLTPILTMIIMMMVVKRIPLKLTSLLMQFIIKQSLIWRIRLIRLIKSNWLRNNTVNLQQSKPQNHRPQLHRLKAPMTNGIPHRQINNNLIKGKIPIILVVVRDLARLMTFSLVILAALMIIKSITVKIPFTKSLKMSLKVKTRHIKKNRIRS